MTWCPASPSATGSCSGVSPGFCGWCGCSARYAPCSGLLRVVLKHRVQNTLLALSTAAVLLIATCGAAMLALERDAKDANITSVPDALWWATSTVTTVGYGDRFPVTGEGRVVAVVLMVAGVGLFGTLSGTIAASMMGPKPEEAETAQLLREMKVLRTELAELKATLNAGEEKRG